MTNLNWELAHSSLTNVTNPVQNISLNPSLTGKYIIVLTDSLGANPKWYRAGYLLPFFDDSQIGRVYSQSKRCALRRHTFIKLTDWEFLNNFEFRPVPWLVNIQIKIWSTSEYSVYDQMDRTEEKVTSLLDLIGG